MKALGWVLVLVVLVGLGAGGWYYVKGARSAPPAFRTVEVIRTDVESAIAATGTLVPEETVDVGAQVNGKIASFGTDKAGKPIDYRSEVSTGMLLAKIDDSLYVADLASAKAQLAQATAQKKMAQANRDQAQAKMVQSDQDLQRSLKLKGNISQADIDAAQSTFDQAKAAVAVQESTISQYGAQEEIAKSAILRAQQNLDYCTITSPVDGVIIDKKVDVGQTVVASMNAPSLFLMAKDLKKLLVLVQVNEADIGAVQTVKAVTFAVDAVPARTFKGTVRKIRLNASMSQNVVTYTVEIEAENPDLALLPYLTANVRFVTARREDVLAVPNAALRFTPPGQTADMSAARGGTNAPGRSPGGSAAMAGSEKGSDSSSKPTSRRSRGEGEHRSTRGTIYTVGADGSAVAHKVHVGITDGTVTEVTPEEGQELAEDQQVIVGMSTSETASGGGTSPFMPRFGGRRGR